MPKEFLQWPKENTMVMVLHIAWNTQFDQKSPIQKFQNIGGFPERDTAGAAGAGQDFPFIMEDNTIQ